MEASDSSTRSQGDHFLPNRPRLSFRVPEPVARPGQAADVAAIAIHSAGSVARPDVSVPAGETHALAHTLIRVLDEEGGAVGPWNPGFDHPTLLRLLKDMVVVRSLAGRMYRATRQGTTSFYMKSPGQEASSVSRPHAPPRDDQPLTTH